MSGDPKWLQSGGGGGGGTLYSGAWQGRTKNVFDLEIFGKYFFCKFYLLNKSTLQYLELCT